MSGVELFGTASCPWTREMREWLELRRVVFVEHDVVADSAARRRLREITGAHRTVPVLVEDGRVTQVGWQGRGCVVGDE